MAYLKPLNKEEASPEVQEIFDQLNNKMGMVPNIYATIGNSPAALKANFALADNLKNGEFSDKEVEAIALAISEENNCGYCLAAHTAVGQMLGFSEDDTIELRSGNIDDPKLKALTNLAKEISNTKGRPSTTSIDQFLEQGYTKAALVELIGFVALNTFNNYLNHIAETPVDFPSAKTLNEIS